MPNQKVYLQGQIADLQVDLHQQETTIQDFGYRIEQLEKNTDLSGRIDQQDKDIERMLGIITMQTELLEQFEINLELITAKLP